MEGLHQSLHSIRSACCLCGSRSTITTNGLFQASSSRCHERDPNQSYPPGAFGWTFLTPKDHPKRDSLEMPGAARQSSATMKTAAPLFWCLRLGLNSASCQPVSCVPNIICHHASMLNDSNLVKKRNGLFFGWQIEALRTVNVRHAPVYLRPRVGDES